MNFNSLNIRRTLFIDIETVSEYATFGELPDVFRPLWIRKAKQLEQSLKIDDEAEVAASYKKRAAIYAEFGKIVCISIGFITKKGELRIKTIGNHNEFELLEELALLLKKYYDDVESYAVSGHNIKEFDIPYICRRMLKHGIPLPALFDITSKRPWQTEHLIDTMDLWRFGDYKAYTSLALLCAVMGVESPKSDMDGSMVGHAYWEEQRLSDICAYCANDVEAVARLLIKFIRKENEFEDLTVLYIPPVLEQSSEEE